MDIKLIILDVDGTLTDGGIYYDENGVETKRFCTQDGAGILNAEKEGIDFAIITGRESGCTTKRAADLRIKYVFQGVDDKKSKLAELMSKLNLSKNETVYIGDDLNDLKAMELCGFVACPTNACAEVKSISNYVAKERGGYGAVREILEYLKSESRI